MIKIKERMISSLSPSIPSIPIKIAFLFLTIGDLRCGAVWKDFFRNIPSSQYSIYHHGKHRDRIPSHSLLFGKHISQHVATQWAHSSLVRATLLLLQEALEDSQNTFFILCSESCIPLVPFQILYDFLLPHQCSFFCYNPLYFQTKDSERRYQRFQGKKWLPHSKFMKADQWFILYRDAAKICAEGHYFQDFERIFASDEHYFINVCQHFHVPFQNRWSTFCDYEYEKSHPLEWKELSHRFLDSLRIKGFFFLRKVSPTLRWIS